MPKIRKLKISLNIHKIVQKRVLLENVSKRIPLFLAYVCVSKCQLATGIQWKYVVHHAVYQHFASSSSFWDRGALID